MEIEKINDYLIFNNLINAEDLLKKPDEDIEEFSFRLLDQLNYKFDYLTIEDDKSIEPSYRFQKKLYEDLANSLVYNQIHMKPY